MSGLARAIREPAIAIFAALLLGFLIVLAVSDTPLLAYQQLLFASFASTANFGLYLNRTMPLILIGLGVVLSFRAGLFNVGGEGQLYVGAIACAAVGVGLPGLPADVLVSGGLTAACVGGAAWAWWPGALKLWLGVDEVVTTLMGNFVAMLATNFLVTGILRDPAAYGATSRLLPKATWLPSIPLVPGATIGVPIALVLAGLAWVLLFRTVWGADLRMAGSNLRCAEAVGIRPRREVLGAMGLSGALAGLAGGLYVLGIGHRFEQNFSPGFGLMALTVALLARLHPLGLIVTSLIYALLLNGAAYMEITTDVPRSLVDLLTGLLVLLMTAELGRRLRRRART